MNCMYCMKKYGKARENFHFVCFLFGFYAKSRDIFFICANTCKFPKMSSG